MKKVPNNKILKTLILIALFFAFGTSEAKASFRFVSWGDTKSGTSALTRISNQVKALPVQPVFTLFAGDLIESGSTITSTFLTALSGGNNNGMINKTFAVRGNHDSSATSSFQSVFQFGPETDSTSVAAKTGVTHYSALSTDLTYSFDYQNAHFVGIDMPGGDVQSMPSASMTWLDQDLTSAENRGLKHAFLFWHGPLYHVDGHSSLATTALINVLNKHQIISATFHGHEHLEAYTRLNSTRLPGLTKTIEQIVSGSAGAGPSDCASGRTDFCQKILGFSTIDVLNDTQFTVSIYKDGTTSPVWQQTFTKGSVQPTNTPRPSVTSTPTPRITPTGTIKPGDVDRDGDVDILDFQALSNSFGKSVGQTGYNANANFNSDTTVNILDFQILSNNFGK